LVGGSKSPENFFRPVEPSVEVRRDEPEFSSDFFFTTKI